MLTVITSEIKTFLKIQKLGYVATVSSDGKPNISPKGTIIAWSDNLLAFANIRSPDTVMNLQHNPFVEINVIDPLSRKGYLFTGTAKIIKNTPLYVEILNHYRTNGIKSPINSIVIVDISSVSEVTSPLYDLGQTEEEIKLKWKLFFNNM
jgi:predicted pyridoxine 5'-phosphate oxidase superfamily flavin-nucleotide-binding protein